MNSEIIYMLSSYQIDYLRDLFRQEGDITPANIKIEFLAVQNGNLHIGMIKYGSVMKQVIGRYPNYELSLNFKEQYLNHF